MLLFVAIYFQVGLGLSPTETGLRILPLTLASFYLSQLESPALSPMISGLKSAQTIAGRPRSL
ncbi:MAG: hypothetical protein ABW196_10565 [Solirubrobacterales bacterium]